MIKIWIFGIAFIKQNQKVRCTGELKILNLRMEKFVLVNSILYFNMMPEY